MTQTCIAMIKIATAGLVMLCTGLATAQSAYPVKPIRFIVPFPPGGATNIVARLVGQKLTDSMGQQVIVDNRPGGNTIIGNEALARSAADGYTIGMTTSTLVISPHLLTNLPYDAFRDFIPVATLVATDYVLAVHPSVAANTLQEFIALARSRPGQLNYATSAAGGPTHLAGELFNIMAGVRIQHIPYKGGRPALTDLLGGQVQLTFSAAAQNIPYIRSGKLKAIAIAGDARSSALPQVPTFTEAGLPGFNPKNWLGVSVPTGTSKAIIDRLSTEIARVLAMPDIRDELAGQGVDPFISTPEQFAALMKADSALYGRIIKTANIKIDN